MEMWIQIEAGRSEENCDRAIIDKSPEVVRARPTVKGLVKFGAPNRFDSGLPIISQCRILI
jgi:hypothetical protein